MSENTLNELMPEVEETVTPVPVQDERLEEFPQEIPPIAQTLTEPEAEVQPEPAEAPAQEPQAEPIAQTAPEAPKPEKPAKAPKTPKAPKEPKPEKPAKPPVDYKALAMKISRITFLVLGIALLGLCVLQLVQWGFGVLTHLDSFKAVFQDLKHLDYINLGVMVFMLLFVVLMVLNLVKGTASLIKKGHEVRFEAVSTLIAFCVFAMFVQKFFAGTELVIEHFGFGLLLLVILGVVLVYSFLRLIARDFGARIWGVVFSSLSIVAAIVLYTQNAGSFATVHFSNGFGEMEMTDFSGWEFAKVMLKALENPGQSVMGGAEAQLINFGLPIMLEGLDLDLSFAVILLQMEVLLMAHLLPFAALSLLGYLVYGIAGKDYIQFYNLYSCKKVAITMLVFSILSVAGTVGLSFLFENVQLVGQTIHYEIDYLNCGLTVGLCIVLVIFTSMPWKIYNSSLNRRFNAFKNRQKGV